MFEFMFAIFPIFFFAIFGLMIFIFVKAAKQSQAYKKQPRISAEAELVEKRTYMRNDFTHYYATFQFETGDRIELRVPNDRVGLLVEGDRGTLTFQGDMFIDFGNEIY